MLSCKGNASTLFSSKRRVLALNREEYTTSVELWRIWKFKIFRGGGINPGIPIQHVRVLFVLNQGPDVGIADLPRLRV